MGHSASCPRGEPPGFAVLNIHFAYCSEFTLKSLRRFSIGGANSPERLLFVPNRSLKDGTDGNSRCFEVAASLTVA